MGNIYDSNEIFNDTNYLSLNEAQEVSQEFDLPIFPFYDFCNNQNELDDEFLLHKTFFIKETENSLIKKMSNLEIRDFIDIQKNKKKEIFRIEKDNTIKKQSLLDIYDQIPISKDDEINDVIFGMNKVQPIHKLDKKFDEKNELTKEKSNTEMQIGKKRKRPGKKCKRKDNCLMEVGRNFFNKFLLKEVMGDLIKKYGPNYYFRRFPQKFIRKAMSTKDNKFSDKTLKDFLTNKDLYEKGKKAENGKREEIDEQEKYFKPNNAVLMKLEEYAKKNIWKNDLLNDTLNKKYRELYEEYLYSEEYNEKIDEFDSEEDKKKFEDYSKNFIKSLE